MSRNIDLNQKLSEEDREYLLARGREQLVFRNDAQFRDSVDPDVLAKAHFVAGSTVDRAPGVLDTPGVGRPNSEAARTAEQVEDDEVEEADSDDYADLTNDELREELASRDLPTTGKKKELVARLRADDESDEDDDEE